MSKVRLTSRGIKLLVATAPVAVIGLALRDHLLLALTVVTWLYLAVSYRRVGKTLGSLHRIVIKPGEIDAGLTAGGSYSEPLLVESGLGMALDVYSTLSGASIEPSVVAPGANSCAYSFSPVISGRFTSDSLYVSACDRFMLVAGSGEVAFPVSFEVNPRVFPVAVRALQFLAEGGLRAEGEYSTTLRGRGLEYAETRQYVPGDPMSMFDWKALARTGTPYVKQYYIEGMGGYHVVYDGVATDPVTLDELNSGFLGLVLSLAQLGVSLRLGVLEGGGVVEVAYGGLDSLRAAMRISLSGRVEAFREYYRVLEPMKMGALDNVLRGGKESKPRQDTYEASQRVVVASSLSGDPVPLIGLASGSGDSGISVYMAGSPWVWEPSLSRSAVMYNDAERVTRILRNLGVGVYSSVEELMRHLSISTPRMLSRVV